MNPEKAVNSLVDKHPYGTGTLLLMVVGGMLLIYGIAYLILRNRQ
jgi:hypothetical protein